jgi:hypothetical protein
MLLQPWDWKVVRRENILKQAGKETYRTMKTS